MNYKKLLKNVLLSAGTIVTASNAVFAVRNLENATYNHFFCTQEILWKEATIASKNINNFYGVNLTAFEPCSSSNTNDDVFMGSAISNLYLPFFEYDEDSLFSLFTALDCIDFQNRGQTIWLPPYYANIDLETSMQACMNRLSAEDDNYVTFDIRPIIRKVRFYTQEQIQTITEQRLQFFQFIRQYNLKRYMRYINRNTKPARLRQDEWDNIKARANNLMAAMHVVQPNG